MTVNRASGLFVVLVGLVMVIWVIPCQTETVDYGWLKPATLPSIACMVMILAAGVHALFSRGETVKVHGAETLRAVLFLLVGILGLILMARAGFVIAAPLMVLVMMVMVGERRWKWLLTGVLVLPAFIWFIIEFLLGRPLP